MGTSIKKKKEKIKHESQLSPECETSKRHMKTNDPDPTLRSYTIVPTCTRLFAFTENEEGDLLAASLCEIVPVLKGERVSTFICLNYSRYCLISIFK